MGLLVVGLLTAVAAALAAALIGAPVWMIAAAYPLGGVVGIAFAAWPVDETAERRNGAALSRT